MPKTITVTLTDEQVSLLEYDVLDIDQWVQDAVTGRVHYSAHALAEEARAVLMADPDVDTMPAKPDALIAAYLQRPSYQNRKQREQAAKDETTPTKQGTRA